jgi:hypothetical protein
MQSRVGHCLGPNSAKSERAGGRSVSFPSCKQEIGENSTIKFQKFEDGWKIVASVPVWLDVICLGAGSFYSTWVSPPRMPNGVVGTQSLDQPLGERSRADRELDGALDSWTGIDAGQRTKPQFAQSREVGAIGESRSQNWTVVGRGYFLLLARSRPFRIHGEFGIFG